MEAGRKLRMQKLFTFSRFILKEFYVSFPGFFRQRNFANGRKVTTIAFMKGAKQPQAFPQESPETAAQKESHLFQHTQMNDVSRNLLLQEVLGVFRHRGYIVSIPRNAAIGKYEFHMKTMKERRLLYRMLHHHHHHCSLHN